MLLILEYKHYFSNINLSDCPSKLSLKRVSYCSKQFTYVKNISKYTLYIQNDSNFIYKSYKTRIFSFFIYYQYARQIFPMPSPHA